MLHRILLVAKASTLQQGGQPEYGSQLTTFCRLVTEKEALCVRKAKAELDKLAEKQLQLPVFRGDHLHVQGLNQMKGLATVSSSYSPACRQACLIAGSQSFTSVTKACQCALQRSAQEPKTKMSIIACKIRVYLANVDLE